MLCRSNTCKNNLHIMSFVFTSETYSLHPISGNTEINIDVPQMISMIKFACYKYRNLKMVIMMGMLIEILHFISLQKLHIPAIL